MAKTVQANVLQLALETLVNDAQQVLSVPGTKAEISLYSQFEDMFKSAFDIPTSGLSLIQQANAATGGVPDYRVQKGTELLGWIEVKAVLGKDLGALVAHDATQLERFSNGLGNVLYTTGWQWRLYQNGRQVGRDVVLGPKHMFDPNALPQPATVAAIDELVTLLQTFASATTQPYSSADVAVQALAVRAKGLKLALVETGRPNAGTNLQQLEADFKALLFKNGLPFTWERFVDSYVQLAVFGALLWRLETGNDISLNLQVGVSSGVHPLLAQCLAILWSPQARLPILEPLLEELCKTINNISPSLFTPPPPPKSGRRRYVPDPLVHAYEPFFKAYDPAARETSGVYYTPVEIVEHITSGLAELLRTGLGKSDSLLDPSAQFLDPATGTGTFLLGLINAVASEATAQGLPVDTMVEQVPPSRPPPSSCSPVPTRLLINASKSR